MPLEEASLLFSALAAKGDCGLSPAGSAAPGSGLLVSSSPGP